MIVSTFEIDVKVRDEGLEELKKIADRLGIQAASIDAAIERAKKRNPASIIDPKSNSTFNSFAMVTDRQIGLIGAILSAAPILFKTIEFIVNDIKENEVTLTEAEKQSIQSMNDAIKVLDEARARKKSGVASTSDTELAKIIFGVEKEKDIRISVKGFLENLPGEDVRFFDEKRIQNISQELEKLRTAQEAAENAGKKLNETGVKSNEINDESIKLKKEDGQSLLDLSKTQNTLIASTKQLTGNIEGQSESLRVGNQVLNLTNEELLNLPGKLAMVDGAFIDATANQGEFAKSFEDMIKNTGEGAVIFGFTKEELEKLRTTTGDTVGANEKLIDTLSTQNDVLEHGSGILELTDEELLSLGDKYAMLSDETGLYTDAARQSSNTTADLTGQNSTYAKSQNQVNQTLDDGSIAFDNVGASAEEFGETIEQVQNQGGFFEGIKQGFKDFVENVQSNSELMADFFADTLSQMSQSFSDLFFNIITGRFDDLKDLAKQTFEAILRAFLDLVSAIVTKQIVISIAGVLGFGKDAGAGDLLGFGKQAAGIGADLAGIFGGGSGAAGSTAIAGGATSLGTGTVAIGSGLGGISSVGTGAATVGATSVLDVSAAGGALGGINAVVPETGGFLASIGGVAGAITIVGAVLAAAALAFTFLAPLFKKTPRLDIDFDSVKTEAGRRAALVSELLDDDFLKDEIIDISVKRKAGLGLGGDEGIKDVLADAIQVAVNNLLDIINKLPTDLAETLSEELLNTPLDTETEVAGERLFEFDAKGKKIAEKFNQLINGEIQAKFLFAVDGFLQTMFESLGVLPKAAEAFLDERFEEFKNAGSREARAKVGQELLADINAFVDAFNIVSGNVNDAIGQTIQSINSLSRKLGFDAVPSIGELTDKLGELIQNAELDAETVQKYADLRNAIVQGISDIINSISGLIGKISQLNSTIVDLGGSAVNIVPFLDQAQAALLDFFKTNVGNLSLGEQEAFLDELLGIANAKLAEEQAAFQRAQEARQKAEEAQRARIEKRIDNLNKEKDKINEVFNKRIEALNEELQIAESFAQLTESIRQTLDSILFSPESVLTGVEQVNALKSNITNLQAQLASTADPERQLEIAGRLEEAFKTLFDTAGDAFGVNSPEFVAIFDQVTGGLESLAEFTEGRGRSVEEISAEIERLTAENEATLKSIDAKIEAAQERLASIGQSTADNTFHASQGLQELFEYIRSEYIRILEERFAELGEVSEFGFQSEVEGLGVIAGFTEENLTVLKGVGEEAAKHTQLLTEIADRLGAVAGFQQGSEGFKNFGRGTLAVLHGLEAVVTKRDIAAVQDSILHQIAGAGVSGLAERLAGDGDGRGGLIREGFFAGTRPGGGFVPEFPVGGVRTSPDEPVNHVTEMSVDINVNVNGGSQASIASLAGEIENMMVRSIRQGRVRKELQEAAVRRVG